MFVSLINPRGLRTPSPHKTGFLIEVNDFPVGSEYLHVKMLAERIISMAVVLKLYCLYSLMKDRSLFADLTDYFTSK